MWEAQLRTALFWLLVGVTVFNAVTAIVSGIALLATDGLGMPAEFLADSPFSSFTLPGLILIVVVGGTQALAAGLLIARRESALLWTAVAGFGMLIWIFTEIALILEWSWLQVVYVATGTAQLALVFALLGIASWLPRLPLRPSASRSGPVRQRR